MRYSSDEDDSPDLGLLFGKLTSVEVDASESSSSLSRRARNAARTTKNNSIGITNGGFFQGYDMWDSSPTKRKSRSKRRSSVRPIFKEPATMDEYLASKHQQQRRQDHYEGFGEDRQTVSREPYNQTIPQGNNTDIRYQNPNRSSIVEDLFGKIPARNFPPPEGDSTMSGNIIQPTGTNKFRLQSLVGPGAAMSIMSSSTAPVSTSAKCSTTGTPLSSSGGLHQRRLNSTANRRYQLPGHRHQAWRRYHSAGSGLADDDITECGSSIATVSNLESLAAKSLRTVDSPDDGHRDDISTYFCWGVPNDDDSGQLSTLREEIADIIDYQDDHNGNEASGCEVLAHACTYGGKVRRSSPAKCNTPGGDLHEMWSTITSYLTCAASS